MYGKMETLQCFALKYDIISCNGTTVEHVMSKSEVEYEVSQRNM